MHLEERPYFVSGTDYLPPLGFGCRPTLIFHEDSSMPTSSTCDIHLSILTGHKEYASFKEAMKLGLHGHGGFSGF